jgi:hypothetical protein
MFNPCSIAIIGQGDQDDDPAVLLERNRWRHNAGLDGGPAITISPRYADYTGDILWLVGL